MVGPRRRSREIAIQVIYLMDANPELSAEVALRLYFDHLAPPDDDDDGGGDEGKAPHDTALLDELVRGFAGHRAELDELFSRLSQNWRIERISAVERNVIRLALFELRHTPATPVSVAINEAVELAKRFGTSEGAAFVNGMLDRAATELDIAR
jgi:N utilization substance protein B